MNIFKKIRCMLGIHSFGPWGEVMRYTIVSNTTGQEIGQFSAFRAICTECGALGLKEEIKK